ncbi:MAG: putative dipeptidase [Myxococcaceae bacterium]|nr:putative dipeptidase [Myxococcaceae bacterium]
MAVAPVPANETLDQRVARVHGEAIIVDGHNDIPTVMVSTGFDLSRPMAAGAKAPVTHTDLARMKKGGITGEFFSIYVDRVYAEKPTALGGGSARRALDLIDVVYQQIERHPDDLMLATTADDIRRAKREHKIAALLGIEGGHAIENSLSALREFHRLGVRYMTLTHSNNNDWADSAGFIGVQPAAHHGLTPFGEEVVHEMQRIGMLVDISHTSDETFEAVMKIAKAPVIASHSSSRAISPHRRNLTDDMLKELAKNGGVAMVNFWTAFLDPAYTAAQNTFFAKHGKEIGPLRDKYRDDHEGFLAALEKLKAGEPAWPKTPLSMLVDHIEHMVKVAGIDHVGIGSDFDGVDSLPEGLTSIDMLPNLTRALLERGMSDDDVKKILGGNFLRVFDATEAYAKSTKTTLSGDGSTRKIDLPDGGAH